MHGSTPGKRSVYRVPAEPVPDVTIEVLSPKNDKPFGRRKLEEKRALLGAIGVPVHIELDPDRGLITIWHNVDRQLIAGDTTSRYDDHHLGGLHIELAPGEVALRLPDGREYTDAAAEYTRADRERQRADGERQRAERLAEALRNAGIDPTSV